jgi:integral membrane protein
MHKTLKPTDVVVVAGWYALQRSVGSNVTASCASLGSIDVLTSRHFAWLAIAEAGSFVLLLVGMLFKYGFDNEAGVSVMGPIHGVLFIAYMLGALIVRGRAGWSWGQTAKILLAGIVPIAGFFVGERLMKQPASAQVA